MEKVPEREYIVRARLGTGMYNQLQFGIAAIIMARHPNTYKSELEVFDDMADDMRNVIEDNADRVLPAFEGKDMFSPIGHEELLEEIATKSLESSPFTKGKW